MIRRVIHIDEAACNGCGICVSACHEGAIGLVDGKARLLRDDYCDGLGDCLPACPTGAITFVEREAAPYDEAAVKARMAAAPAGGRSGGCPGSLSRFFAAEEPAPVRPASQQPDVALEVDASSTPPTSQLAQWPVEIKLVPVRAPYFEGLTCWWRRIARPSPTLISIEGSCATVPRLSGVRSSTPWITPRSWLPYSLATTSRR